MRGGLWVAGADRESWGLLLAGEEEFCLRIGRGDDRVIGEGVFGEELRGDGENWKGLPEDGVMGERIPCGVDFARESPGRPAVDTRGRGELISLRKEYVTVYSVTMHIPSGHENTHA